MYNEEEIEESLEFCRDIKIYYEHGGNKGIPRKPFQGKEAYGADRFRHSFKEEAKEAETIFKSAQDGIRIMALIGNKVAGFLAILFIAYGISSFLENYCIWQTTVEGISMEPSLEDGDFLLIDKTAYLFREPRRFEIVVFPHGIEEYYVKRIIGLPGVTVQIIEGTIYIDGIVLAENYGKEPMSQEESMKEPIVLSEDEYFVLGDNRNYSIDSRSSSVGVIQREHLIGRAWILLYPFERRRTFP